jgi:hypothetical protein
MSARRQRCRARSPPRCSRCYAFAVDAVAVGAPVRAEVSRARVRLGDVLRDAVSPAAEVDLGPSPQPGALRVLTRDDLVMALTDARLPIPAQLPSSVRITRRVRALTADQLEQLVRDAVGDPPPVACVLAAVRASSCTTAAARGAIRPRARAAPCSRPCGASARFASTPTALEATRRRLVGATLRRAMAERAPITDEDVAPTPPIARGAAVQFELRRGGLLVRGRGTLERAARIGEQVLVRLSAASTPVRGTLVSATEVVLEGAS